MENATIKVKPFEPIEINEDAVLEYHNGEVVLMTGRSVKIENITINVVE